MSPLTSSFTHLTSISLFDFFHRSLILSSFHIQLFSRCFTSAVPPHPRPPPVCVCVFNVRRPSANICLISNQHKPPSPSLTCLVSPICPSFTCDLWEPGCVCALPVGPYRSAQLVTFLGHSNAKKIPKIRIYKQLVGSSKRAEGKGLDVHICHSFLEEMCTGLSLRERTCGLLFCLRQFEIITR